MEAEGGTQRESVSERGSEVAKDGGTQRESERASETGSGREASARDEASDTQLHLIRWSVPLEQFQMRPGGLYLPKPPLMSPTMTTSTGALSLDWQLCLRQQHTEAKVELNYKTRDIPNQGVQYTVWARKADGRGRVRLNTATRQALASFRKTGTGRVRSIAGRFRAALAERVVQRDGSVKLEVVVKLSLARWAPERVLQTMLEGEREKSGDYADGTVGTGLWAQVCQDTAVAPPEADLTFVCPGGRKVFAHKAVVAAFCPRFAQSLRDAPKGKWRIGCEEVSAQALWELLHFLYLRKVSPTLYRAPLAQVLEAARLFNQPRLLSLEVERLLVLLLEGGGGGGEGEEAVRLWTLAQVYRLPLLLNAAHTAALARPALLPKLQAAKARLHASRLPTHQHALAQPHQPLSTNA